jgi:hypothetical protein
MAWSVIRYAITEGGGGGGGQNEKTSAVAVTEIMVQNEVTGGIPHMILSIYIYI